MTSIEERFTALEETVMSQQEEITNLRDRLSQRDTAASLADEARRGLAPPAEEWAKRSSRRMLLKGGVAAAGAAVAAATVVPQSAAAADGDTMRIGRRNESEGGNTHLLGTGNGQYVDQNILTVSDQNDSSSFPAAIGAYGEADRVNNGLYAFSGGRSDSDTNTGHAIVARSRGGRSNLLLTPSSNNPNTDTYAHRRGALRCDGGGSLWFCASSGTPGVWRKLAGPASAGAVHAVAPSRVYDSRFADGPLASGFNRLVSVADAIDVMTGDISAFNTVPEGASAIYFNVTLTDTTGAGFLLVAPGDATEVTSSTLNWSSTGQTVANASLTTLDDDRNVRAFVGGAGSTHFIIDVTGYTL